MTRRFLLAAVLVFASPLMAEEDQGFVVVVNPENPQQEITVEELSRLFLKKAMGWEHGEKAEPVDLSERSATRDRFSRRVHGRRTGAIKSFWQRMIFSGRGTPPPEVDSDEEVVAYVGSRPGAVGYVTTELPRESMNGVRVLEVVEDEGSEEGSPGRGGVAASLGA